MSLLIAEVHIQDPSMLASDFPQGIRMEDVNVLFRLSWFSYLSFRIFNICLLSSHVSV